MEQETQKEPYIALLEDSLEKKCKLLDSLYESSKEQETLFNEDNINEELFNRIIEDKDKLIQIIIKLDAGFELIYQRVKDELSINPTKYKNEIMKIQSLVSDVTDKGIQLQVIEKRNKLKIEDYFRTKRKDIKDFKISNQSATNYYKNMADQNQQQAYFFDKKN